MNSNPDMTFSDYTVLEKLGETSASSVYRAIKKDGKQSVIIKIIRIKETSPEIIARFRHEYELIQHIDCEGVVKPIDVFSHEGSPALVLEDFGGVSLKSFIDHGFSIDHFLSMGIRISEILNSLHERHITHRDIKPHNILLNPDTDTLKITDFGISVSTGQSSEGMMAPSAIAGTLAYISPEQTGRMNCGLDYRTDMYSLGVTFYEMLTGIKPFQSEDHLEMIHSHIAKTPVTPHEINPDIPEILSGIVIKLMAKSPQDRYQNCLGLASDLRQCLRSWKESGTISPFELGTKDISPHFNPPFVLVGREKPLADLYAAVDRVGDGAVEMVLLAGEPGIGKSALANEVRKPLLDKRGYFISGKFDQYQRAVPYSALIQAFQSLIRQLFAESDERLIVWKDKLSAALGQNGKIITDIIPELEMIIGQQPDLPDIGPEETQNRFNFVFKNFVRVFADMGHPMVLFLDDIQWADVASLNLMTTIVTDKMLQSFLFLVSYRDNEMSEFHPFMLTSDIIRSSSIPVQTIQLGLLDNYSVLKLISTFIPYDEEKIRPFAQVVHQKTKGSPFFINQFLKSLYDKKCLRVDPSIGWTWDLQKIKDMEATENVVSFMAGKLHELPPEALEILKAASCISNHFDLVTLSAVSDCPMDKLVPIIASLIHEGLISYTGHDYRFYHDRIQEVAYSLMFTGERENIHCKAGYLELDRTPPEKMSNRIFFICDQLNKAGARINGQSQRFVLAELNLKAGIKAKESTAYSAAASYLKAGCDLLDEGSWTSNYQLAYSLFIEHMECRYLNRDITEAEHLFNTIITHAADRMDKGRAYGIMIALYTSSKTAREAVEFGLEALGLFGINLDINMGKLPVMAELVKTKYRLKKTGIENIPNLPVMEDKEGLLIHELLMHIGLPSYFVNRNLYALVCLKGFNDYFKRGLPPYFCGAGCVTVANLLQTVFKDYDASYRLGDIALALTQRFNDVRYAGPVNHMFGFFLSHWKEPIRNNLERYSTSYELSLNSGNLVYAGLSISTRAGIRLMLNHRIDDVLNDLNSHREFMMHLKDPLVMTQYHMMTRLIMTLKGMIPFEQQLSDSEFNINESIAHSREKGNLFGLCSMLYYKMNVLRWNKQLEAAVSVLEELDKVIHVPKGTLLEVEHYFLYSLTLMDLVKQGAGEKQKAYMALVRRNMKKLMIWARQCPENFKHKYDLVTAELKRIEGRFNDAVEYYHQAINGARTKGYLANEAMACELLAEFYFDRGYIEEGRTYIIQAYKAYISWGATAKAEMLKGRYKESIINVDIREITDSLKGTGSSDHIIQNLDFHTVMKVSQVISREIKLDRLLKKTMHMSITNSGAERGYLIFESEGSLVIQASEDVKKNETDVLQAVPVESCKGLCPAIVNYVYHSGESVILGNALASGPFTNDPYIAENKCKSILCLPVKNKGKLTCIFYMENNLAYHAFTDDRLEILRVIFAQVSISLQNAMLYEEISSEIAVRKQAEEHMKVSETKYRTILEELQDIYCETDIDGIVSFTNPSAWALTGYNEYELVGSSFRKLFQKEDQLNLEQYYREIKQNKVAGKPLSCKLIRKNGKSLPLEILTSPILSKNGDIAGYRNVARDVSDRIRLENDLLESLKNVHAARAATILGLAKLAEYRDEDTGTHLERIREYSRVIAVELAKHPKYNGYITQDYIEDIYNSSILHDIGKVGVPDSILLKPGKLTHEEFEIIKTHTSLGGDALKTVENQIQGQTFLTLGKEIAYYHHEKWDGTGYPKGLKGIEIPLSARIVALADVYDALTSKRVYKDAFPHEKAIDIIVKGRGSHFAPDIVDAFILHEQEFRRIREELFEEERLDRKAV